MGDIADWHVEQMMDADAQLGAPPPHRGMNRPRRHIKDCPGDEVVRTNHTTNVKFMGCSNFPTCKWSRDLTSEEIKEQKKEETDVPF